MDFFVRNFLPGFISFHAEIYILYWQARDQKQRCGPLII